jgi:hypothetical protein
MPISIAGSFLDPVRFARHFLLSLSFLHCHRGGTCPSWKTLVIAYLRATQHASLHWNIPVACEPWSSKQSLPTPVKHHCQPLRVARSITAQFSSPLSLRTGPWFWSPGFEAREHARFRRSTASAGCSPVAQYCLRSWCSANLEVAKISNIYCL